MKVKSGKIEVKNSLLWVQSEFSKRKTNCNLEVLMKKVKKNYNVHDAIDFIFDRNQSDFSGLSSDEKENDETEDPVRSNVSDDEWIVAAESDGDIPFDDDISLAETSNQASSNDQG